MDQENQQNPADELQGVVRSLLSAAARNVDARTVVKAIYEVLSVTQRWDVVSELERRAVGVGAVRAELNWLQEIENSAILLLERAPDIQLDGESIVAEEAARIFSRIRLILPKEHVACHWVQEKDEAPSADESEVQS